VQLHHCDGWSGYKAMAPYDVIHVGASANSIPDEFLRQLKVKQVT
jgi:protein-L-isoaspartate O-methyltransferase